MPENGIVTLQSAHDFRTTFDRLRTALAAFAQHAIGP
jgi:hypothetical protein